MREHERVTAASGIKDQVVLDAVILQVEQGIAGRARLENVQVIRAGDVLLLQPDLSELPSQFAPRQRNGGALV